MNETGDDDVLGRRKSIRILEKKHKAEQKKTISEVKTVEKVMLKRKRERMMSTGKRRKRKC